MKLSGLSFSLLAITLISAYNAFAQQAPDYSNSHGSISLDLTNFGVKAADGGYLSDLSVGTSGNGRILLNGTLMSGVAPNHRNFREDVLKLQETYDVERVSLFNFGTFLTHKRDSKGYDLDPENPDQIEIMIIPYGFLRYRNGKVSGTTANFHGIELNDIHTFNELTQMYGTMQFGLLSNYNNNDPNNSQERKVGAGFDVRAVIGIKRKIGEKMFARLETVFDTQSFQTKTPGSTLNTDHSRQSVEIGGGIGIILN